MEILVLCTGNICRSPMAQAFLAQEVTVRRADAEVSSAGFVTEGRDAEPHALTVLADRGLHLDDHRSRIVTSRQVQDADLVIGMTREHVRLASNLCRDAFPHVFALKELVRRGAAVGPADGGLAAWLTSIAADREHTELLGNDDGDDIADPMGRTLRRFRACRDEIEANVAALADLLWPDQGL